jgi:choline-sulfatase
MDWTITSIIDQLKESGLLDKTLVVITADHGEMLGEDGGPVGHGWAITPELANVPLIIMDPGHPGYHINNTIGSQVDLLPTILDSLGIPQPPGELYQGASLYSQHLNTNRIQYLNSYQQYGEVQGSRFVRGNKRSDGHGRADTRELYDITNDGPRTVFSLEEAPATNAPYGVDFDRFQKNLLRNYSVYCRMFRSSESSR